jgi:hypothetical protein
LNRAIQTTPISNSSCGTNSTNILLFPTRGHKTKEYRRNEERNKTQNNISATSTRPTQDVPQAATTALKSGRLFARHSQVPTMPATHVYRVEAAVAPGVRLTTIDGEPKTPFGNRTVSYRVVSAPAWSHRSQMVRGTAATVDQIAPEEEHGPQLGYFLYSVCVGPHNDISQKHYTRHPRQAAEVIRIKVQLQRLYRNGRAKWLPQDRSLFSKSEEKLLKGTPIEMPQWITYVINATRRAAAAKNDLEATMRSERALMKRWVHSLAPPFHDTHQSSCVASRPSYENVSLGPSNILRSTSMPTGSAVGMICHP